MDNTQPSIQDELKDLAPWLHEMRQSAPNGGYQVPEGYFEGLEHEVLGRLGEEHMRPTPALTARRGGGWISASRVWIAAAALVAIATALWLLRPTPATQDAASIVLTEEEVEAYIADKLYEFEVEQLATLPDDNTADSPADTHPAAPAATGEGFSPEDVNKYLPDMSEEELEEIL